MAASIRVDSKFPWRLVLWLALALGPAAMAQSGDDGGPLQPNPDIATRRAITNDSIIRMTTAGLDEVIILQTIQAQPGRYDVAPESLIALKDAGVSARVIAAMQAKMAGLSVHEAEPAPRAVAVTPLSPGIDEIGVYYKDDTGNWVPLKVERVVFKSGGWVKSTLTHNIVKPDMNGHLNGPHSPLKLKGGIQLMIYTPVGTAGEEYDFLHFREHKDDREFRTSTGGVFHSESGTERDQLEFSPHRVAPQMYSFTVPADLKKGEYGVLPPGSSNMRGMADTGKIFTFSIPE